ncbi:sugar phosphate isomerase/epimerase family protein [Mixta tenebrionis]|uniref:Sugar phosphate isomerase/epimerase n=1 Tax=Mixta tenebrionis TaxID=2562439 RepID=A0A506V8E3_9GAMM|nr:sugar phosphate isomerase/epimerase family protein [Mixta tenebrionis]TPW41955.1 sugar phosphate isomerase/epimerase [Mixta tenebrionis]
MSDNLTFLNLVLLSGETPAQLQAAKQAGFDRVEIWQRNVESAAGGAAAVREQARQLGLGFINCQVLSDFAGAPLAIRDEKRRQAQQFFQLAQAIGCDTVQAPACTRADCQADLIDEDLRWLSAEAARRQLRIMYEPMAWSAVDNRLEAIWRRLERLALPNVGLVVDLFHITACGDDASVLDAIPMEQIYEVQLCDTVEAVTPGDRQHLIETARHRRLLPGDGNLPVAEFVSALKRKGYHGPVGIEVFNDRLQQQPPQRAAQQAFAALRRCWS